MLRVTAGRNEKSDERASTSLGALPRLNVWNTLMLRNLPRHFVVDGGFKIRYDRAQTGRWNMYRHMAYQGSADYKPAVAPTMLAVGQQSGVSKKA